MVEAVVQAVVQVGCVGVLEPRHLLHAPVSFHLPQEEELEPRILVCCGDGGGGVAGGGGQLRGGERRGRGQARRHKTQEQINQDEMRDGSQTDIGPDDN